MISATVFTLTTYFSYTGDGGRVAVGVEGYGTTEYIPDYARGGHVLVEKTATTSTLYLYGQECLAERRDGDWAYYLYDGTRYVRQVADEEGEIESAWRYDPDGLVREGPQGPVSHLACGGMYDWSTGLIYKDGRYFDPTLGIWLALMPLAVIQWWRRRKRKGKKAGGLPWYVLIVLVGVGVGGGLIACSSSDGCKSPPKDLCVELEVSPLGGEIGDRVVLFGPKPNEKLPAPFQDAMHWTDNDKVEVHRSLQKSLGDHYGGDWGFGGGVDTALTNFQATAECPITLVRMPGDEEPMLTIPPYGWEYWYIQVHTSFINAEDQGWKDTAISHELAHYWDYQNDKNLSGEMWGWVKQGDALWLDSSYEDFAYVITHYFCPARDDQLERNGFFVLWSDDRGSGYKQSIGDDPPDDLPWDWDRFDYLGTLGFRTQDCSCKANSDICTSPTCGE